MLYYFYYYLLFILFLISIITLTLTPIFPSIIRFLTLNCAQVSPSNFFTRVKFTLSGVFSPRKNYSSCKINHSVQICLRANTPLDHFCLRAKLNLHAALFSCNRALRAIWPVPIFLNKCDDPPVYGSFKTALNFYGRYVLGLFRLLSCDFMTFLIKSAGNL